MNRICLIVSVLMLPFSPLAMAGPAGVLQKYSITSIHLVPMTPISVTKMYYQGPGPVLIGTLASGPGTEIKETAEKNDIQIDRIATDEVQRALESSQKVAISSDESSPYSLTLAIYQFGFSAPNGFSSKLVPVLTLECQIKSADGKSLWKDRFSVLPLGNPVSGIKKDDLLQDPKRIDSAWREVAKYLADKCVNAL
jgi:hypothetical protein